MNESSEHEVCGTPEINEKIGRYYVRAEDGSTVNNLYDQSGKTIDDIGFEIPRLRIAHSADYIVEDPEVFRYGYTNYEDAIYDENGMDIGYNWVFAEGGLKEYLVFNEGGEPPLYLFDNHNHALFAWQEGLETGVIEDGAILLRFDHHLDMALGGKLKSAQDEKSSLSREVIRNSISNDALNGIDIENFTHFAFDDGLIDRMAFVHGMLPKDKMKTAIERTVFNEEYVKRIDLVSDEQVSDRDKFAEMLSSFKDEGRDIILDIDFDVFSDTKILDERKEALKKRMREALDYASLVTCATSPGYGNHSKNVEEAKEFVESYLEQ